MISNVLVIISEVDTRMYVILSEAEYSALRGISWYHRIFDAIDEVSYKPRSL